MRRLRLVIALGVIVAVPVLAGCASTVAMSPAENANDPACAAVTVRLPATVEGQQRRWTDAQATGAWGAPATTVLLHCGVPEPGPSTLPCDTVGWTDWLVDDADAPYYRFTSFGTSPAVEVYLDSEEVSGRAVLDALDGAVRTLPKTGAVCLDRP